MVGSAALTDRSVSDLLKRLQPGVLKVNTGRTQIKRLQNFCYTVWMGCDCWQHVGFPRTNTLKIGGNKKYSAAMCTYHTAAEIPHLAQKGPGVELWLAKKKMQYNAM